MASQRMLQQEMVAARHLNFACRCRGLLPPARRPPVGAAPPALAPNPPPLLPLLLLPLYVLPPLLPLYVLLRPKPLPLLLLPLLLLLLVRSTRLAPRTPLFPCFSALRSKALRRSVSGLGLAGGRAAGEVNGIDKGNRDKGAVGGKPPTAPAGRRRLRHAPLLPLSAKRVSLRPKRAKALQQPHPPAKRGPSHTHHHHHTRQPFRTSCAAAAPLGLKKAHPVAAPAAAPPLCAQPALGPL